MTKSEAEIAEQYRELKLDKIGWIEFGKTISDYLASSPLNLQECAKKLGITASSVGRYSKAYNFLATKLPSLLDDPEFKKTAQSTRVDDLRRLFDKQPEYFDDKNLIEFTKKLMLVDSTTNKKMLLMAVDEEEIRISDRDILHTELLIRIIHDKLKDLNKDPRAKADLRLKLGPILHECAINLESIVDPKFAASLELGRLEEINI